LPPPGTKPIVDRWRFGAEVVGMFFLWFVMWFTFRYTTSELVIGDEIVSAILSIIAAPTLSLIPPVLWWRYRMREMGIPYLLTRRHLFSSVFVACIAAVLFAIAMNITYPLLLALMGVQPEGSIHFFAAWRAHSIDWLISVTFLYMIIVGPVEELFHRGFLQDQLNRAFRPWFGIAVASVLFVLGHVPIDVLVYKVSWLEWGIRWISSFPFAVAMGVFYHWSRNIWGVAVYHGLYDWFLGIAFLDYAAGAFELTGGQWMFIIAAWSLIEVAIIIGLAYVGYRIWWKGDRPAGSLGFTIRGISFGKMRIAVVNRAYSLLKARPIIGWTSRIDVTRAPLREIWTVGVVAIVILGTLAFSGALGIVPDLGSDGQGPGPSPDDPSINASEGWGEYLQEGSSVEYSFEHGDGKFFVIEVNAELTWNDEAAFRLGWTNNPDRFKLEIFLPNGTSLDFSEGSNGVGSQGSVLVQQLLSEPMEVEWLTLEVTAVSCGDHEPFFNPLGQRDQPDNGNQFTLSFTARIIE
jgi:membrane protease YdiL (CAAX protease family)